jgi:hypothetical protein
MSTEDAMELVAEAVDLLNRIPDVDALKYDLPEATGRLKLALSILSERNAKEAA